MALRIIRCDDSHRDVWNSFVDAHGSFYHRFEWYDVNRWCFGHQAAYLAALEDERLVGVFPIVQVKSRLFGNIACSLPFVNYGGPCGLDEAIERALIDEAGRVAEAWHVDYLEIRSRKSLDPNLPCSKHKVSMTVDMSPGLDAMWTGYSHSHRKDIKRGYKNGFTARVGHSELLDDFYVVLSEAWRNMGTPIYSKRYFDVVATVLRPFVRFCVIYKDGEPAAASFQAHYRGVGEGLWLGCREQFRHALAGYVLYWELLKDAGEHGCSSFHLGRSTADSNAEVYKRKWNAYPTPLYWQYMLRSVPKIPQVNVTNPKYRLAISAWRHLPISVTTTVGPILARNIP